MALSLSKPIFHHTTILSSSPKTSMQTRRRRTIPNQLRVCASAVATSSPAPTMYDLLSVSRTAGPDEIKAAFRREAKRWHPDTCHSSNGPQEFAERFMQAKEAYEVLSDPNKRHGYDMSLMFGSEEMWRVVDRERDLGFGDNWEVQLERLKRRVPMEDTWAARMRRANGWD